MKKKWLAALMTAAIAVAALAGCGAPNKQDSKSEVKNDGKTFVIGVDDRRPDRKSVV